MTGHLIYAMLKTRTRGWLWLHLYGPYVSRIMRRRRMLSMQRAARRIALHAVPQGGPLSELLTWLATHGAHIDGLRFAPSSTGGLGAFTTREFASGELLASIPNDCVLTARVARESVLGRAARAAAREWRVEALCTDAVLLWIYMATGRVDTRNPFHPYLASLPAASPDPACWSEPLRAELAETPAGAAVEAARAFVIKCFNRFVSRLGARLGPLIPPGSLESAAELFWARGMCVSRSFPAALRSAASHGRVELRQSAEGTLQIGGRPASDAGSDPGAPGCLLPLFDLLNHSANQPIAWVGTGSGSPAKLTR